MRNIDNNFMKLFILATHLTRKDVCMKYERNTFLHFSDNGITLFNEGNGETYNFLYPFIIRELPFLYSQWIVARGQIIYEPAPQLSSVFAFCEFMGLDPEEFIKIFIPNQKALNEFGLLTPHSGPTEVAERVFEYLDTVLVQRETTKISDHQQEKNN